MEIKNSKISTLFAVIKSLTKKVSVYRNSSFNAAHRLHVPEWSDEQNKMVFGLCNNPNYHGHNYELQVKVTGEVDPVTGFVIDLKVLKELVEQEITEVFDHRNLNLDIPEFKKLNPTAENIAIVIWEKLRGQIASNLELAVRLYETPRNFVEYNG